MATIFDALADHFGLGKWFGVEDVFSLLQGSGGIDAKAPDRMGRLTDAFDTLGGCLRNPTDESARRKVGSILRSRTDQIANAGGRDLTLEATLKRDRNLYRVTAMRELTSLSTDLNLGQTWEPMKAGAKTDHQAGIRGRT